MDYAPITPLSFRVVEHQEADDRLLDAICAVKDESWPHGLARQRAWLDAHIDGRDLHVLGFSATGGLVAYASLVRRAAVIDGAERDVLGVGNVCVRRAVQGSGLGAVLMQAVARYLRDQVTAGVLLCKDALVPFYARNSWSLVDRGRARAAYPLDAVNIMILDDALHRAAAPDAATPDIVLHGAAF